MRNYMLVWASNNKDIKLKGPIEVESLIFKIQIPKSWGKQKRINMANKPHIVVPDLDNLEKAFFDVMTGILFDDDCQIWKGNSRKVWAESGSIYSVFNQR